MVRSRIANIQISHPGSDDEQDEYWSTGQGADLRAVYAELLGMQPIHIGYHKLVHADGRLPEIGFEFAPDDPPPRWPDDDHPQQVHLDIEVDDIERAHRLVVDRGATLLADAGTHRVFADPVGHPFCLYPGGDSSGRIVRVVFDGADPSTLAAFYGELLGLAVRTVDTADRVEITGAGCDVALAFQRSNAAPPDWPNPSRPAQIHLDIDVHADGAVHAERLGARRIPNPDRPDSHVYADPGGHPFCLGLGGFGTSGPAQVEEYEEWRRGPTTSA